MLVIPRFLQHTSLVVRCFFFHGQCGFHISSDLHDVQVDSLLFVDRMSGEFFLKYQSGTTVTPAPIFSLKLMGTNFSGDLDHRLLIWGIVLADLIFSIGTEPRKHKLPSS